MLELAASLNRATPELMWIAAVGLNSQWTDKLITIEAYTDVCYNRMRPFIHKFSPRSAPKANDLLRVSFDKELPLAMYPHWSLYRAMMVNEHFACKTKNWTQKGDSDVKHLLANLGLTLNETKQKFEAMSSNRKKEVTDTLEKEMASSFASFIAHLGYCNRVNAADVARGVAARLETPRKQPLLERFESAQSVLLSFMDGTGDFMQMLKTFELYKANSDIVESRHFLFSFAHFLLRAFAVLRRGRTARPLIITFPLGGDMQGWNLVTGVMPLNTVYEDNHQKR
uniref:Guanylate cyclase domain-containing protein n=1 Tax=Heterorhabditis bacteriophora TaxID=37862 RepID=A0A1I7XIL0_HETBA